MTTTYDPFHPKYFDELDLRDELTRVYDLCHGCRLCFKYCTAFPTLFEFIDVHDDQDAAKMTPGQQDQVVDECFNCKLCYINCPYIPGQSDWNLDFPRLMLRAQQTRVRDGDITRKEKVLNQALGRTDLLGKVHRRHCTVGQRHDRHAGLVHPQGDGEDRRHRLASGSCRPSPAPASRPGSRSVAAPSPAPSTAHRARSPSSPPASSSTRTPTSARTW